MAIKLIFTDLDGTFLDNDGQPTTKNKEMVELIHKEYPGTKVVFATGTGPERAIKYAQKCGIDQLEEAYMICYNGGAIIKLSHGKQEVIWRKALSVKQGQDVISIAKKYQSELQVYSADDKKVLWLENVEKFNQERLAENQPDTWGQDFLYKGLLFFKEENEKIDEIIAELKNDYPEFEITRSRLSNSHDLFKTHPNAPGISIEINPKGVDKGQAVKVLSERLNVSLEDETIAFGDEKNDQKMLEKVWLSVAMANGNPEIIETATFETDSNDKSGFAKGVQHYVIEERHLLYKAFESLIDNFHEVNTESKSNDCEEDEESLSL